MLPLLPRVAILKPEVGQFYALRVGQFYALISTADVIIKAVGQAYLKAKGDRTMNVPTEKNRLQQIKAGRADHGILPVPPDESIGVGDILTFREATFDHHQIPTLVPNGDAVSMRITKAEDTGNKHGGWRLYAFRWQPVAADG